MTLTVARSLVRDSLRNGADTAVYGNDRIDRAIISIGTRLANAVRALKGSETIALSAEDPAFELAENSDCSPDALMEAYIEGQEYPLQLVEWTELLRRKYDTMSGEPEILAFDDTTSGEVYPTPSAVCNLILRYTKPFAAFTAGTASPNDVTLALPDDLLYQVLPWGPAGLIHLREPENAAYGAQCWAEYTRLENSLGGQGNLGARVIVRRKSSDL